MESKVMKKQLNKLQNSVIKENASSLAGACKLYSVLFSNSADLKKVCKELEIPAAIAVRVSMAAKDKKFLVAICQKVLPKVDDTFVKLSLYEKTFKDKKENAVKGLPAKGDAWLSDNSVKGCTFKPFGNVEPELYNDNIYHIVIRNTDNYTAKYVWCPIRSYSIRLVAKCVSYYLSFYDKEEI